MSAAIVRLAGRRGAGRAARRALLETAVGRLDADERRWIAAIEDHREALLAEPRPEELLFEPETLPPSGAFALDRERTPVGVSAAMLSLPPGWGVLLMKLARHRAPRASLELGTGFGISTAYLAAGLRLAGGGELVTLEGSEVLAARARETLDELGLGDVRRVVGPIAETLPAEADRLAPYELAFIDAEHQTEATLDHFRALAPGLASGAVVVLDDVNWAPMRVAHDRIAADERIAGGAVAGRFGLSIAGPA